LRHFDPLEPAYPEDGLNPESQHHSQHHSQIRATTATSILSTPSALLFLPLYLLIIVLSV
jgi:hypothetical protein